MLCGYLAAIGFFGDNQFDSISELSSAPVTNLLLILVGMPLPAVVSGWLLAGREPAVIGRQPMGSTLRLTMIEEGFMWL